MLFDPELIPHIFGYVPGDDYVALIRGVGLYLPVLCERMQIPLSFHLQIGGEFHEEDFSWEGYVEEHKDIDLVLSQIESAAALGWNIFTITLVPIGRLTLDFYWENRKRWLDLGIAPSIWPPPAQKSDTVDFEKTFSIETETDLFAIRIHMHSVLSGLTPSQRKHLIDWEKDSWDIRDAKMQDKLTLLLQIKDAHERMH